VEIDSLPVTNGLVTGTQFVGNDPVIAQFYSGLVKVCMEKLLIVVIVFFFGGNVY
jgi:hypothetical protein